jgi:hypothetical protein
MLKNSRGMVLTKVWGYVILIFAYDEGEDIKGNSGG